MSKKLIPTEDLLRIVKEIPAEKPVKLTPTAQNINRFYKEAGLIPGVYEVPSHMIYSLYLKWEKNKPIHIVPFYKEFNKTFQRKVLNFSKLYFVNLEPFNLTVEQHSQIIRNLKDAENKKFQESFKKSQEKKARKQKEDEIRRSAEREVAERLAKEKDKKG